jgi:hypothetical protein
MYFVSTSPHGSESVSLIYIDNKSDANPGMLHYNISTGKYAAPGNAFQKGSAKTLDAGDCRINSAFYLDGLIHFTFNASNENGFSSIVYCRLDVGSKVLVSRIIQSTAGVDYAYGSLASFSKYESNKAVVLTCLASGKEYFPSARLWYVDDQMNIFDKGFILNGTGPVEMLSGAEERWGDYTTVVRDHQSVLPAVWLAVCLGRQDKKWQNTIALVGGDEDTLDYYNRIRDVKVFPNPAREDVRVGFMLENNMVIEINLYDTQGKEIDLYNDKLGKGLNELSFDSSHLAQGLYILRVINNGVTLKSEKILIAR